MDWLKHRKRVERITHKAFSRTGTVTPTNGDPFAIHGVLHEGSQAESLAEEVGIHATAVIFEVRRDTETATYTLAHFPRSENGGLYGRLELEETSYDILYVHQTDTLLFLGLAGPRP